MKSFYLERRNPYIESTFNEGSQDPGSTITNIEDSQMSSQDIYKGIVDGEYTPLGGLQYNVIDDETQKTKSVSGENLLDWAEKGKKFTVTGSSPLGAGSSLKSKLRVAGRGFTNEALFGSVADNEETKSPEFFQKLLGLSAKPDAAATAALNREWDDETLAYDYGGNVAGFGGSFIVGSLLSGGVSGAAQIAAKVPVLAKGAAAVIKGSKYLNIHKNIATASLKLGEKAGAFLTKTAPVFGEKIAKLAAITMDNATTGILYGLTYTIGRTFGGEGPESWKEVAKNLTKSALFSVLVPPAIKGLRKGGNALISKIGQQGKFAGSDVTSRFFKFNKLSPIDLEGKSKQIFNKSTIEQMDIHLSTAAKNDLLRDLSVELGQTLKLNGNLDVLLKLKPEQLVRAPWEHLSKAMNNWNKVGSYSTRSEFYEKTGKAIEETGKKIGGILSTNKKPVPKQMLDEIKAHVRNLNIRHTKGYLNAEEQKVLSTITKNFKNVENHTVKDLHELTKKINESKPTPALIELKKSIQDTIGKNLKKEDSVELKRLMAQYSLSKVAQKSAGSKSDAGSGMQAIAYAAIFGGALLGSGFGASVPGALAALYIAFKFPVWTNQGKYYPQIANALNGIGRSVTNAGKFNTSEALQKYFKSHGMPNVAGEVGNVATAKGLVNMFYNRIGLDDEEPGAEENPSSTNRAPWDEPMNELEAGSSFRKKIKSKEKQQPEPQGEQAKIYKQITNADLQQLEGEWWK